MSHEPIVQPSRNGQHAADVVGTHDPEVVPKAERRQFPPNTSSASLRKPTLVRSGARLALCCAGKGSTARTWTNGVSNAVPVLCKPWPRRSVVQSPTRKRLRSPGCAARMSGCSSACSGPRQLSRSKKTFSAARPADERERRAAMIQTAAALAASHGVAAACSALAVKAEARDTYLISLANGELQGYIATEAAAAEGGYEASNAIYAPAAGWTLVEATLRLLIDPG